jgi:SagB-type dehydrogenase family enzyme
MRSYRYCFWDNGTILANLLAAATAAGLPVRVLMGFVDVQVDHLLGLDGHREASTCLASLGQLADLCSLVEADQGPPLSAEIESSSVEEIDYPEIARLHTASALIMPEEVVAWRGFCAGATASAQGFGRPVPHPPDTALSRPAPSAGPRYPLRPLASAPAAQTTLGDVIRQRGSTRRFAREPMSFAQLSAILAHATTGVPADFLGPEGPSLLDIYLIVNAVTDLPAGSYVFVPQEQALHLLSAGDFREEAGHLCFEQALGADASVVVFFMADLESVLQRFGNRGYRAVQLEAGILGGKMYLCAGALGWGASGLTFYDDDVTAFFAPHASGKSAIFVVAMGQTARENRVRPFRSRVGMRLDALSRRDC